MANPLINSGDAVLVVYLRTQADKRPNQEDRNPNHLLRHPHG